MGVPRGVLGSASGDRTMEGKAAAPGSWHGKLEERCRCFISDLGLKNTVRLLAGLANVLTWPLNSMA